MAECMLYRTSDGPVGGVCGGIARCLEIDPGIVRLVAVALAVLTCGVFALVYLACWLVLPQDSCPWEPVEVDSGLTAEAASGGAAPDKAAPGAGVNGRAVAIVAGLVGGSVLIASAAAWLFMQVLGSFPSSGFWSLLAMAVGVLRLVLPSRSGYSFPAVVEGGALFFLGIVTLLAAVGALSLRVDGWFLQNWPLLLVALGLLLVAHATKSRAMAACAVVAIAAFCAVGLLFYADMGPAAEHIVYSPMGSALLIEGGIFYG